MIYRVIKVMNNNVVLAIEGSSGQEVILIGRGIGFNKKPNQELRPAKNEVDKIFRTYDEEYKEHYHSLLNGIDSEILGVCAEIVAESEKLFGEMSKKLFLVLSDHISFAIERLKNGMDISNPFLYEIQMLYSKEFNMGIKAKEMIKNAIDVEIPDGEVGFIALHIHAARNHRDVKETVKNTRIIRDLIELIEKRLQKKITARTLAYDRLVSHLRYCIERIEKGESIENPLGETVKIQFPEAYLIATEMIKHVEKILNKNVSENELVYMTLHIDRLRKN